MERRKEREGVRMQFGDEPQGSLVGLVWLGLFGKTDIEEFNTTTVPKRKSRCIQCS
jgi:hypothetical protein